MEFAFSMRTKPLPVDSIFLMQSSTIDIREKGERRERDLTRVVLVSPLVALVNSASVDACNWMLLNVVIGSFVVNVRR